MISQLSPLMAFDTGYIDFQHELNVKYYQDNKEKARPWGFGKIYNSISGATMVAGDIVRTPGQYTASDPKTGKSIGRRLKDTQEHIHASVRIRKNLGGLGIEDKGAYNPSSLVGWRLVGTVQENSLRWEYGGRGGVPEIVLQEDKLGDLELKLLATSPEMYKAATEGGTKLP